MDNVSIVVSTSAYLAFNIEKMHELPYDLGIEAIIENGNDNYWDCALNELYDGKRTGELTFHGPFLYMNLSDKACKFDRVIENYKWTFEKYHKYGAKHIVLHPYSGHFSDDDDSRESRRDRCLDHVNTLVEMADKEGAHLLIENLPYAYPVLTEDEFINIPNLIPTARFLIDTGHYAIREWDICKIAKALGSRIEAYHVDDNMGKDTSDSHYPLGKGNLDCEEFAKAFNAYTPNARLVLEYLNVTTNEIAFQANYVRNLIASNK